MTWYSNIIGSLLFVFSAAIRLMNYYSKFENDPIIITLLLNIRELNQELSKSHLGHCYLPPRKEKKRFENGA